MQDDCRCRFAVRSHVDPDVMILKWHLVEKV